jgi:C-terminal processing protease CtpA/Prc
MKKLILILSLLFTQCTHPKFEFNGSFEIPDAKTGTPSGWLFSINPSQDKEYIVKLDSTIKQSGKFSVSIEKIGNNPQYNAIDFPIDKIFEGDEITLKGFVRTENVKSGYAGLWMRFHGNEKVLALNNMQGKGLKGTQPWKPVSITLPYDRTKVTELHLGGFLVGDGKAWFDNLEILINGKPLSEAKFKDKVLTKSDVDTAFKSSSGIKDIKLNTQQITNLTLAGQFWSFLKYHHPSVAKGEYNWDAELFRLLPGVIASKDNTMLSKNLELFVDKLPKLNTCKECSKALLTKYEITPDYGSLLNASVLSASLTKKLEVIKDNRNTGPNYYIEMGTTGNPLFKNEKSYASMSYPDIGYRILSLYRYWSMINYFFPYRNVIGEDWNLVLPSSLPDFINAKNELDYSLAALKIIARVKDTHANIYSFNKALEEFKGRNSAPFQAKFIEGKLVITALHTDTLDVKEKLAVGDIISKIEGIGIDEMVKKFLPYTPASNYDTQLRNLSKDILLRSNKGRMKLNIIRQGHSFEYNVPMGNLQLGYKDPLYDNAEAFKVLDNNIGYVFPGKYKNSMLGDIKKGFQGVKGIIIDMRCYPSDFMPFSFGSYIKDRESPFVKFTLGSISHPGSFHFGLPIKNGIFAYGNGGPENYFKGKVIVLVNSSTQSQAEYTTIAFQSAANVSVLGSTTAGADGDVSQINLPGGISTMISGVGVFYPDGAPSQRVGVKINYKVYPTIKGITAGKDELMEKAIEILNNSR